MTAVIRFKGKNSNIMLEKQCPYKDVEQWENSLREKGYSVIYTLRRKKGKMNI